MTNDQRIAVAIPCFNEAAAIAVVVAQFRAALPGAEIVVFDNNSTDGTGAIARELGVRVVDVPEQGKGHAVRSAFATLGDFDVIVLTDGDGTYPAEAAPLLIAPVLEGDADMTVGARQPMPGAGAMTLTRGIGNRLIRAAFRILIGPGNTDLLSGYRAFSRRFRAEVSASIAGFEIETELASEAVARRLRVVEISIAVSPADRRHPEQAASVPRRPEDPRDDRHAERAAAPLRLLLLCVGPFAVLAVTVHRAFAAAGGVAVIVLWSLYLIDVRARRGALRNLEVRK